MPRHARYTLLALALIVPACGVHDGEGTPPDASSHADSGTPRADGSAPGADSGTPADDAATPPTDAGMQATDGGRQHDAGTPPDDATTPPTDAGTPVGMTCTSPMFMTSDPDGGWSDGGYYVHNNMWNDSAGLGPETLYACSYHSWYVVSNQTNSGGAVKTYPNVHRDYDNVPIRSFHTLTSTFAATSPHVGIYDVAYDIWTNGVADPGSTEFMIWTENFHQVPAGDHVTTVTLGGRAYDVWKESDNHYIAFVPTAVVTSGSVDLLAIFNWTIAQGWLPANSTLGQVDFGVEIVSTGGAPATFQFTDFSITSD
jgi:hypothetical protein